MEFIRTNCILTFNMYHATIFIFSELILQGKKKKYPSKKFMLLMK